MTQPQDALKVANARRMKASAIKRDLARLPTRQGFARCAELVAVPDGAGCLTVEQLLLSVRLVGRQKALTLLNQAGIRSNKRLDELCESQRGRLAGLLWERVT